MVIAADSTARVQAEASLRDAYEFNQQVIASAQEGIIVLDGDGRYVVWNTYMAQLTGHTVENVLGKRAQEVLPALDEAGFESLFQRVLAGEALTMPDQPFDLPENGARQWYAARLAPLRNAHGDVTGVIGTIQDITARRQMEAALRASEARYRRLVERAADIIYETDPTGRFTYFNRAATKLLGFSAQELLGTRYSELVHPDYRASIEAFYRRQFHEKTPSTYYEFPALARDGHVVWLGQNVDMVIENGRLIRHLALARDITERTRVTERRRRQRAAMENLQQVTVAAQTTAALAHELNQPLNAVCSYSEAALRMLGSGNPQPDLLRHALESSVQQSQRAGKVMRDLLVFLARDHLPATAIDLNGVVRRVLADMDEEAKANAITIALDLCADLRPVLSHRLHIEKVLVNLLRNGFESIRGHDRTRGAITVTTARRRECALVTVHDSGPGLTDTQVSAIFQPFYTTRKDGVGMGLTVSQALIGAHGGRLWAEAGAGGTFHFTLPFAT
jgi:PAS domain S-box-containing protein